MFSADKKRYSCKLNIEKVIPVLFRRILIAFNGNVLFKKNHCLSMASCMWIKAIPMNYAQINRFPENVSWRHDTTIIVRIRRSVLLF